MVTSLLQRWLLVLLLLHFAPAAAVDSPWQTILEKLGASFDRLPQGPLAAGSIVLGAVVAGHGHAIVRPTFVLGTTGACGVQVYLVSQSYMHAQSCLALLLAFATAATVFVVCAYMYTSFQFFFGCILGGSLVFVGSREFIVQEHQLHMLGAMVIASMLMGLSFMRFHDTYWRLLTAPMGGLLAAAGVRHVTAVFFTRDEWWAFVTQELERVTVSVDSVIGSIFWTTCCVVTLVGWYFQISPLLGWRSGRLLPKRISMMLSQYCECLCGSERKTKSPKRTVSEEAAKSSETAKHSSDGSSVCTGVSRGSSLERPLLEMGNEAADGRQDYRPELAVVVAVLSVLLINKLLENMDALFLGHVVLMSAAFLPFATAGMVSYSSRSLLLTRLFGPRRAGVLTRHFTHATFMSMVLLCAVGGYICIYGNHERSKASQLGLDPGNLWVRVLHVWVGYLILGLLALQVVAGAAKLCTRVMSGEHVLRFHHTSGRVVYCLAACNQLLGYTFPGLMPVWATALLSGMLISVVATTIFFLNERSRAIREAAEIEAERVENAKAFARLQDELKQVMVQSTPSTVSSTSMGRSNSRDALESASLAIAKKNARIMVRDCFKEWRHEMQRRRLEDAETSLQEQDRLVQFLSQELVNDTQEMMS